jgi:hypothetical protein
MSFGTFYEVADSIAAEFEGKSSKSDWYEVLGKIDIESFPSFDAFESIPGWEYSLQELGEPLSKLFAGDLSAKRNEYDDPDVVFLRSDSVKEIYSEFINKGRDQFEQLLSAKGCLPDIWMFEPLVDFLKSVVEDKKSMIVLWGG